MNPNQAIASAVVARLREAGVRTFCLCPGGRNAPLVEALEPLAEDVELLSFFDERSAGFFAFGRARRDRRPVAVVTTSGTAAAELLPALIEAYYSGVPLIAVTADRPRDYRRTGAPQAIEQVGLYGVYAPVSIDVESSCDAGELPPLTGPAHINVCFSEPLLAGWQADDGPAAEGRMGTPGAVAHDVPPLLARAHWAEALSFLQHAHRPLVIAGGLQDEADSIELLRFCRGVGAPVLAEASSGIREALDDCLLRSGDLAVEKGFERDAFDSVIRIGDVPSYRVWRDLDLALTQPVLSISRKPWRGLTRGLHLQVAAGEPLLPASVHDALEKRRKRGAVRYDEAAACHDEGDSRGRFSALYEWDRRVSVAIERWLDAHPESEPAIIRRLSEKIPAGSFVYLGNSLPIREWNQFATVADRRFRLGENRGANGIDGQVASFLGWARPGVENWAVVGDLTALYDLSSLWALRHLDGLRLRIVVINNGGGRIFERMFRNERFQNRHATGFEAWAAMWGAEYHRGIPDGDVGTAAVIELRPDEAQTDTVWKGIAHEARQ